MENPGLDPDTAAELHNRLAEKILSEIVEGAFAEGGTLSDVMFLSESILVSLMLRCFELGSDVKILDVIVGRVKDRLVQARLGAIKTVGSA